MTQKTIRRNLPGTSYVIDLVLDTATNTGRVVLEKTMTTTVEAKKVLSDLSLRSIQGVLLDLLEDKGLHPNPRMISRVLEDLTLPAQDLTLPTPADEPTPEVSIQVGTVTTNSLLKVKDIIAATNSQMSKLDTLIGSPGLPDEVGSTMQVIQDLLVQAKNVINDLVSS